MWTAVGVGAGVLAAAGLTGAAAGPVLRRLPEPDPTPEEPKLPYRELATPRFAVGVTACALAALLVVVCLLPPATWSAWLPLATVGVLLAAIDARTTYLPYRLTVALWIGTAIGVIVAVVVSPTPWSVVVSSGLGAAGAGLFFWVFWRCTRGLGFGDVRLAPVLGGVPGVVSLELIVPALILGTVIGAAYGLLRRVRGRAGPFPYGPALVAGVFASALLR